MFKSFCHSISGDLKTRILPSDKFKENVIDNSFEMPYSPYGAIHAKANLPMSSAHTSLKKQLGSDDQLAVKSMLSNLVSQLIRSFPFDCHKCFVKLCVVISIYSQAFHLSE